MAWIRDTRSAFKILVWDPLGKRAVGNSRIKWEDNIKTALREVRCPTDIIKLFISYFAYLNKLLLMQELVMTCIFYQFSSRMFTVTSTINNVNNSRTP